MRANERARERRDRAPINVQLAFNVASMATARRAGQQGVERAYARLVAHASSRQLG